MKSCIAKDCDGKATKYSAKELCNKHYQRLRKYGDLEANRAPKDLPREERFWQRVAKSGVEDCWEWQGARDGFGYGMFQWETGKCQRAHRAAFFFAFDRWPEPACLHSCDNPPCVNPAHLREGTKSENSADAVSRNRRPRKYTDEILQAVKDAEGPQKEIARRYGMDPSHVSRVKRFWEPGRGMPGRI